MFLLSQLYIFLILLQKKCQTHFISEGILDQISIALCFIILAPEFEHAFGKANYRSLSEQLQLLLLFKHSQSGNNSALQCVQSIHLGFGGKHIFALLLQQQGASAPLYLLVSSLFFLLVRLAQKMTSAKFGADWTKFDHLAWPVFAGFNIIFSYFFATRERCVQ